MKMSRREFMGYAGGAVAAAALMTTGCSGLRRRDVGMGTETVPALEKLNDAERAILALASLAPSGHNTQPWSLRIVGPGRWTIESERSRWLPGVDPENRELVLSMGAFIETLVLAASMQGRRAAVEILAEKNSDREMAAVSLAGGVPVSLSPEAIVKRRTLRRGMQKREITGDDLKYILGSDGARCAFFAPATVQGRYLSTGTVEANRVQAWREPAQEELADWVRFSDSDAGKHRNGLTPEGMEITGMAGWVVRNFFDRSSVLGEGFRKKTVEGVTDQVANCGGWLVISSRDTSPAGLIETGRAFQRIFLRVRDRMIALHPMTQMLEEDPWRSTLAKELGVDGSVQFILRLGYVKKYPDPVSLRMPLSSLVKV